MSASLPRRTRAPRTRPTRAAAALDGPALLVGPALLACFALLAALPAPAAAQAPSFSEVVSHEFGERITLHHQMVDYLETVAAASPRVTLIEQGRSWEGRRLVAAVVTSPNNHDRLDELRRRAAELADPRGANPARIEAIVDDQPVIVWYGGSIHGNELSGAEGLLKLLERLATADDPATRRVLENAVVLIDPMLNPDGRDAFARKNRENLGREPNPDPLDWNNDFTWWQGIKYRTGHYYFDTNRDWFAHTQRETRARVATMRAWHPQVAVDAHEMGREVEFFFDPATDPYPATFPAYALEGFELFNRAYAAAFDSAGFEYMTRERYNYFYPGYSTSYGSYQGAVGMLYEQGSSRGPALERPDGSVRTLAEALEHQYLAAWTAARTAADRRRELLRDYAAAKRAAVEDGRSGVRRYLLAPGGDPALLAEAVDLLLRGGVEVHRLTEEARLEGVRDRAGREVSDRSFAAGTFVVEAAQPMNRLVRALLEPEVPVPEDFLREARERVERDQDARFYDITAWSLPLLFDLEGYSSTDGRSLATTEVEEPLRPWGEDADPATGPMGTDAAAGRAPGPDPSAGAGPAAVPEAGYAYVVDGRSAASLPVLYHLVHRGHRAGMLLEPTRIAGEDLPAGSVVVLVGNNDAAVHDAVRELAGRFRVEVRALDTGLAEGERPSLGTGDLVRVRPPSVALLAESPVHGYSFGWAWYTLDRQYGIPTTVLRVGSVAGEDLSDYDVLVVPDLFTSSGLARELGGDGTARLRRWVRDGGTLVAVGEAVAFAREELDLLALRSWYEEAAGPGADGGAGRAADDPSEDGDGAADGGAPEPYRFEVPGAVLRGTVEDAWWLSAGVGRELPVLVASSRVYLPPEGTPDDDRRTVVRYAGEDPLQLSGHAWPESLERLSGAVFAYEERAGDGRVIAFTEDPSFRALWRGANRLFLNAVVVGPSAP